MPGQDPDSNAYHRWLKQKHGVDPIELYSSVRSFCCAGVPAEMHQTTWATERAIDFIDENDGKPSWQRVRQV